jgi:hypothetical protein
MNIERLFTLAAATLVLGGCNPRHQPVSAKEPNPALADAQAAVNPAAAELATSPETPAEQKAELIALASHELRRLDREIDDLARRAEGLKPGVTTMVDQALSDLRQRRSEVADRIQALKQDNVRNLQESRTRLASALSEMKRLYEAASLKLDEQDAAKPAAAPGDPARTGGR